MIIVGRMNGRFRAASTGNLALYGEGGESVFSICKWQGKYYYDALIQHMLIEQLYITHGTKQSPGLTMLQIPSYHQSAAMAPQGRLITIESNAWAHKRTKPSCLLPAC